MFEDVTNLTTKLDIQMILPGNFQRAQQGDLESQLTWELLQTHSQCFKSGAIIQELREIFSEQHPENAYFSYPHWCGSWNSAHQKGIMLTYTQGTYSILRVSQLSLTVEESRGNTWKSIALHSTIYEALHLPNVKFFPNLYPLLKVLCFSPVMRVENECYENG